MQNVLENSTATDSWDCHAFGKFYRRKLLRVGLGVNAESLIGASLLYKKAGMHSDPDRQDFSYEKELRPGVELRTR
jgi:mycothiol synthase